MENAISLIQTLGFPIACCVFLCWFVYKYINRIMDENKTREDKYQEIIQEYGKNIATITSTLERMENKMEGCEHSIVEIKNGLDNQR